MIDVKPDTDITKARTPQEALEIARACLSERADDLARRAHSAALDGDTETYDAYAGKDSGLEHAWMLLGDLLDDLDQA